MSSTNQEDYGECRGPLAMNEKKIDKISSIFDILRSKSAAKPEMFTIHE